MCRCPISSTRCRRKRSPAGRMSGRGPQGTLEFPAGASQRDAVPASPREPAFFHGLGDDALKFFRCPDAAPSAHHKNRPPLHRLPACLATQSLTEASRKGVEVGSHRLNVTQYAMSAARWPANDAITEVITEKVKAFHAAGVASGSKSIEHPPGWRESGTAKLYLAYLRDPSGNKICALHRKLVKDRSSRRQAALPSLRRFCRPGSLH